MTGPCRAKSHLARRLFAREFTRLHGAALAKAPYPHFDLLLGGAAALKVCLFGLSAWARAVGQETAVQQRWRVL